MQQRKHNVFLVLSMMFTFGIRGDEYSVAPQQILELLSAQATKENLKLIIGNGRPAVKSWPIPSCDNLKIIAEGGRTLINAGSNEPAMVFEVYGDESILEYFVATVTSAGEFRVLPKEGFMLASHTPVVLRLRMPSGTFPRMSTKVGTRVISLSTK